MYQQIAANKRKTWLIMTLFFIIVGGLAWLLAAAYSYPQVFPYVLVGAIAYVIFSYLAGSSMALAVNGARQIEKKDNPRLWRIVENLAITDGLPMPKVYVMDDPAPNAFATGRDPRHAVVCATTGLLEIMDDTELEGVMAHELGHVQNYDIRVSMIAFALVAVIGLMADILMRAFWFRDRDSENNSSIYLVIGLIAAIVAPIVALLIQMAISRRREYLADATGALTTRYPEGLARALEKIGRYGSATQKQNSSTAHLFFANPLRKSNFLQLFSTHPPVEDRVRRLREMIDQA